jgi:hypothetical protein
VLEEIHLDPINDSYAYLALGIAKLWFGVCKPVCDNLDKPRGWLAAERRTRCFLDKIGARSILLAGLAPSQAALPKPASVKVNP